MGITITPQGERTALAFAPPYDLQAYRAFLRAKAVPERDTTYSWHDDTYTVTIPERYRHLVDGDALPDERPPLPLAAHLYDFQAWTVSRALAARRFAAWLDTGLGKTAIMLEWARQVIAATDGRVLIIGPLQALSQHAAEAARFYPRDPAMRLEIIEHRDDLERWCRGYGPQLGLTNYAKFSRGQLPELRQIAGLVLDEASMLRASAGKQKWNIIHSSKGIPYKLAATATPAPNEVMEYASQASFLEKLRSEQDILWTYFRRDARGNWSVKPHARRAFYQFMASWSLYMRDPAAFDFADILADLPEPQYHEHRLEMTPEQRALLADIQVEKSTGLFLDRNVGVATRTRLSQLAKGFLYETTGGSRSTRAVVSHKPDAVADLVASEVAAGRPTIVWTIFNEESRLVCAALRTRGLSVAEVTGEREDEQAPELSRFLVGEVDVLVSKTSLIGYGLNLQRAQSMVWSGWTDSFEQVYQGERRAYRFGQKETVHIHFVVIPELEGLQLGTIANKRAQFVADVTAMEHEYRKVVAGDLSK